MPEGQAQSLMQQSLARQSPFGLLANFRARRLGLPIPFAAQAAVRADVGWPWRMDWGGHDPASPIAEMHINYHNTAWGMMIFVCTTVFYVITKRWGAGCLEPSNEALPQADKTKPLVT